MFAKWEKKWNYEIEESFYFFLSVISPILPISPGSPFQSSRQSLPYSAMHICNYAYEQTTESWRGKYVKLTSISEGLWILVFLPNPSATVYFSKSSNSFPMPSVPGFISVFIDTGKMDCAYSIICMANL